MALAFSNISSLEELALKGLKEVILGASLFRRSIALVLTTAKKQINTCTGNTKKLALGNTNVKSTKPWFNCLLQLVARKQWRPILKIPEPAQGDEGSR